MDDDLRLKLKELSMQTRAAELALAGGEAGSDSPNAFRATPSRIRLESPINRQSAIHIEPRHPRGLIMPISRNRSA